LRLVLSFVFVYFYKAPAFSQLKASVVVQARRTRSAKPRV